MHVIQIDFATPEYDETIRLRYDVLRKPLGLEFNVKQLSEEYQDIHLACYDQHFVLMGCLVLSPSENKSIKMRQVAVALDHQKKGVGIQLVKAAEEYAKENGYDKIYCHARDTAVNFYLKQGYKKTGKQFTEVSILHSKMEKSINR